MMPLPGEQRVQIFGLGMPSPGTPKEQRRYRVKWRVDGRDRTRAVRTKTEAERFRSRLQMAAIDGESFELETGLPISWAWLERWWVPLTEIVPGILEATLTGATTRAMARRCPLRWCDAAGRR